MGALMPDAGLRSLLHSNLRAGIHWTAIETGMVSAGVPDSAGAALPHGTFWVESKRTSEWAVTLRPAQVAWLCTHARRGGRVFVAVRRLTKAGPVKGPAADELWLCRGEAARELLDGGLRGCPPSAVLGVWSGGPGRWDWAEVRAHLVG